MGNNQSYEWNSDYDSTWEDEMRSMERKKKTACKRSKAAKDMQNYRHGYPGAPEYSYQVVPLMPRFLSNNYRHAWMANIIFANVMDMTHVLHLRNYERGHINPEMMPNLSFYRNIISYEPCGCIIEELLRKLKERCERLDDHDLCIQWIFPLRERGRNMFAKPLTTEELQIMKEDEEVMRRFLEVYEVFLQFCGIQLLNKCSGEVTRADNWMERFSYLNRSSRNQLWITRALKCLGELGYERFQVSLVKFFLEETLCNNSLPNIKRSVLDYFMFSIKSKGLRQELVVFAWEHYKPQEKFVWGPVDKLRRYKELYENMKENGWEDVD
ncbi:opioid growth factor receptor-like [Hyperolius riggenbachi]|uniref:opioid growth factor receptor-like n=1 Tax=Hyperolius riggenbachi TaxID=752182 RepID=UPI0035A29DE6